MNFKKYYYIIFTLFLTSCYWISGPSICDDLENTHNFHNKQNPPDTIYEYITSIPYESSNVSVYVKTLYTNTDNKIIPTNAELFINTKNNCKIYKIQSDIEFNKSINLGNSRESRYYWFADTTYVTYINLTLLKYDN